MIRWLVVVFFAAGLSCLDAAPALWDLAQHSADNHRFSTLFTAQDVRDSLSSEAGTEKAIQWCKDTGVTKVYLEEFRDGYQADRETLTGARDRFRAEGFVVSGCVTTTHVGKPSDRRYSYASCYTDGPTQEHLASIFKYAAGLFDEIMIDDFWFTDCTCSNCEAARRSESVTIGSKVYPVAGNTWSDYRRELMLRLSEDRVLAPAKSVNPKVRVIIKYPQWYDSFQDRGYDVARETAAFDRIWVGTETRDYTNSHWGHTPQYEGYFIMRWLGGIGGEKCGGGWYDSLGTTEHTYVEQARQTILAGARESMLFHFGGLRNGVDAADVEALRTNMPELLAVAGAVRGLEPLGIAAYKPANSSPLDEPRVFDFAGMIGLPLAPCHEFPTNAAAAFLSTHALADPNLAAALNNFIKTGRPVIVTDGLARRLGRDVDLVASNVHVLDVKGVPKSLFEWTPKQLDAMRAPLLVPFRTTFEAPSRVALYLFSRGGWVVENFNDGPVDVKLNGRELHLDGRGWDFHLLDL